MLILLVLFLHLQSTIDEKDSSIIKHNRTKIQNDKTIANFHKFPVYGKSGNESEFCIHKNGEAIISGRGEINHKSLKTSNFYLYGHFIRRVTIGDEITSIGEFSFSNFDQLEEIEFGLRVENIYSFAFDRCFSIRNIIYRSKETAKCSFDSFSQTQNINTAIFKETQKKQQTNEMKLCSELIQIETKTKSIDNDKSRIKYSNETNTFEFFVQNKKENLTHQNNFNENENEIKIKFDETNRNEIFNIYETKPHIHMNRTTKGILNGNCGVNVFYFIDTTTYTTIIKGTGPMANYIGSSNSIFSNQRQYIKTIIINEGVTTIGNDAFFYCSNLISITIPNSVTTIEDHSLQYCKSLTSITIPNNVTTLGISAFSCCSHLISITIGNSVTTLKQEVFYRCSNLTSITIPNSVTTIGNEAFSYCLSSISITIPNSVTTIGRYAFSYCSNLTNITIPNSVTTIGDGPFSSIVQV